MPKPETYRLFLSVPCPADLSVRFAGIQSRLESDTWKLKLPKPQDLHLTLHFLGATPVRVVDDLRRELGAFAHARRPFDLTVKGLGAFPNWDAPSVLWAGIGDPMGALAELHEGTRFLLNSYRLFKLEGSYVPHVTLARVEKISAAWDRRRLGGSIDFDEALGIYPVNELRLMRSHPGKNLDDEIMGVFKLHP